MFLNKVIDSRGVDYIVGLFKGSLSVLAKQWKDVLVIKLLLGDWLLDVQWTICILVSIFFRATEQAQTYLKIWVWHPIKHVFVPACSSVRKVHLFTFLWFWNSRYVISPKICPCILPFFPKYAPSSSSSSLGHSRPSASLSTTNIVDLLSTIIVLF